MVVSLNDAVKDLDFFSRTDIVLFGCGKIGKNFLSKRERLDMKVVAFCDNDSTKWGSVQEGVKVISPQELLGLNKGKKENLLVIPSVSNEIKGEIISQLEELGDFQILENFPPLFHYIPKMLSCFSTKYPKYQTICDHIIEDGEKKKAQNESKIKMDNPKIYDHILVCQPQKTGDHSITTTYSVGTHSQIHRSHWPELFSSEEANKRTVVKITTAIRDPIARDISLLFQDISNGFIFCQENISFEDFHSFLEDGGSQDLFEKVLEKEVLLPHVEGGKIHLYQRFFHRFQEHILDVQSVPFDKEKGYAIIKQGNVEVFMYQLEKLNDLVPELSAFMNLPFDHLENENVADDKWVGSSYKKAKKELKFSQEYFDICYNDPYVKHCYSDADIERFKNNWKNNIDPNK